MVGRTQTTGDIWLTNDLLDDPTKSLNDVNRQINGKTTFCVQCFRKQQNGYIQIHFTLGKQKTPISAMVSYKDW